ncbi:MAG TPA: serine hydrolase domain-containing protein [Geobacterales bacterium]|nr:serine hydrolase domain-containing protein [Geobacterales bacterium]
MAILIALLAGAPALAVQRPDQIDLLMEDAISQGLIAGGVVMIGNSRGPLLTRSYGRISAAADARPMTTDTVFDIASLTKVVVTTSAVMKLAEEGRISLVDPLQKWFPELKGSGKGDLKIVHLMTHTSGLRDFPLSSQEPRRSAIEGVVRQKLSAKPGHSFNYADINFIVLGQLVERASGEDLDHYAERTLFRPLFMNDSSYRPSPLLWRRCAPTKIDAETSLLGQVQDYTARLLGGVSGHAGLFSTAGDLGRFCRMLLNEGELDGRRVLSERAVRQMTAPYFSASGKVDRGLGWDRESPYSAPRGNSFSELSFGHTGYSGTSLWIDPESDLYVIVLTSRLDFRHVEHFSRLRSEVSTVAAELFTSPVSPSGLARLGGAGL